MYKIIGVDLKEYGPVNEQQLRQWLAEGRVDAHTKVRLEGDGGWKHLGEMPAFADALQPKGKWTCPRCGELIDPQFDSCWRCSTRKAPPLASGQPERPAPTPSRANWRVEYQVYRGTFTSWEELFRQAAEFASNIGRERLISISHSEDDDDGVVTVWYWTREPE